MRWVSFKEVKERVSIRDVLLDYYRVEALREMKGKLIGPCPVHGGDSPTAFHVDLEKNIWHCFTGCKRGGNVLDLVATKESISVREAALKLQELFLGSSAPNSSPASSPASGIAPGPCGEARGASTTAVGNAQHAPAPTCPEVPPPTSDGNAANARSNPANPRDVASNAANPPLSFTLNLAPDHPYLLRERGLTSATIQRFGLGYCPKGTMAGRIAIPIHDEKGTLVVYAGRSIKTENSPERPKYKFPKGFKKQLVLYNLHRAKEAITERHGLVLVEGFFDVFRLHQTGHENVVALMGSSMSVEQEALIRGLGVKVTLLFDGDDAGRNCAEESLWRLVGDRHVRLIDLADGEEPDNLTTERIHQLLGP